MPRLAKLLSLLCCLFIGISVSAQTDYCFQSGSTVDLNSLDFPDCTGGLTYDISGGGVDCTNCNASQTFNNTGNITITAFSGGDECDEIDVLIADGPNVVINSTSAPNCNEITFNGNVSGSVTDWSWDFNNDGIEDAGSQSGSYAFTANGNQNVSLTVTTNQGCELTTTANYLVPGPWADLNTNGLIDGDTEALVESAFNDLACVIPYCVDDPEDDFLVSFSDAGQGNSSGTNTSYEITLNGNVIYPSSATAPSNFDLDLSSQGGTLGYNELIYNITDNNGCIFTKEYQVYWEEDSFPTANLDNVTPDEVAEGTSQYCIGDPLEFEISASSLSGVSYIFAIGCNALDFNSLDPVFIETLDIAPNTIETIVWEAPESSCQCANNQFKAYLFVNNPCNVQPAEIATVNFNVRLDTDPQFDVPDLLCQNNTYTFDWSGDDFLGGGLCDADIAWGVTEPDGTVLTGLSDDSDFTWTFDQVGEYEVCLEIESDCDENGSEICQTICVQDPLSTANTTATFPPSSTLCVNETYEPEVTIPTLFCEQPNVNWFVTPNTGVTIDDNNSLTPVITFSQKGDYTVNVNITSPCGSASYNSGVLAVGGAPSVTADAGVLTACPDEVLCFDESFCVDNCNAPFTQATVTVYEGEVTNCSAPIGNAIAWQASGNPLVSFPSDMQGLGCKGSNGFCDFSWLVPADAQQDYTVVVEVENQCGTDIACIPISITIPGSLTVPIDAQVCSGFTIDPSTTALSDCSWLVNGSTVWSPGSTNLVTITQDATVTINCTSGACPQSVSADITVFPAINPSITGDNVICSAGTVTLTSSSDTGVSNQWYEGTVGEVESGTATEITGETGATYEVSIAGTYTVEITDANGCTDLAQFTVTEETPPVVSCNDLIFCETETTEQVGLDCVTVPAGATIVWTITDENNIVINANAPTFYTVGDLLADNGALIASQTFTASYELTSVNSCVYEGQFDITINQLGVNTLSEEFICEEDILELTGGVDANWDSGDLPAGTFSITGGNLVTNSTLAPGTYSNITYNDGCAQQPYEITVYENPSIGILGDLFICAASGSTQTLTASASGFGLITYQWYTGACTNPTEIAGETDAEITITEEGTYCVIIIDENGCSSCDQVTVTLDEEPTASCSPLSFCETESAEELGLDCLTVPAGGALVWNIEDSGGNSVTTDAALDITVEDLLTDFGALSANETFTGSYEFTSVNDCVYSGSYDVTIQNLGIGAEILVDTCFLTDFQLVGGVGGSWNTGDLPTGTFTDTAGNLNVSATLSVGDYTGIGYDSGCSQQPYSITITELPTVSILGEDHLCDNDGATQSLNADASGIGTLTYQWAENGCSSPDEIMGQTAANFTLDTEGTYSVEVTDANGCVACAELEVLLDESPVSNCTDVIFCENLGEEIFDLSCVDLPAGNNTPSWTVSHLTNSNFPLVIPAGDFTVDDLLEVYSPLDTAVQNDELFFFYHQWISDDDCTYLDSVQVTILDENVELEQLDFCSGDELNLTQPNTGDWIWSTVPATSADALNAEEFDWITTLPDAGGVYELRYTSALGCGAVDYEIQVNATPVLTIATPEINQCILTSQDITIDQGIATDITIDYEFPADTLSISTVDLVFDPTALNIMDTDPGQLHFIGSLDYSTLLGDVLTCSEEAFQPIDIVDTLASLAVPSFICQGEEFDIDLCGDAAVDGFDFTIGGVTYTLADCPFEIPELFGTQAYELNAIYGGEFALQCEVQSQGEITIQQQLEYEYSVVSDPCEAGQEVLFNITSGNTTSITLLPGDILSSDVLEAGDEFSTVLTFTPGNNGLDQVFDYDIEITDGVCTTEVISDQAQFIAVPELGISIDELVSDFDGCGNDFLTMQISVPNTGFIDSTAWTMEADYIPFIDLVNGSGLLLPDEIQLNPPPLESSIVTIAAQVFNECGSDVDTVFHIMNPTDIQLQIDELEPQVCPGETIAVNPTINLEFYDLDAVVTPAADVDWNPLTEELIIGEGVPAGDYQVEFTATGACGVDVAIAEFSVFEFFSAEFDVSGFTCADEALTFTPVNAADLSGFEWNFGDMNTANNQFPNHTYDEPGVYEITLSAFHSGANCQVTFSDEVEIGGNQVIVTPGDLGYCGASEAAYSINFENPQEVIWNITNPYTGEVLEYFTESTPVLEFDFDEDSDEVVEYVISVDALDSFGCPSSETVTAEVFPAPKANIGYLVSSATSDVDVNRSGDVVKVFLGIPCSDVQIEFFNTENVNNCYWENNLGELCGESFDNCSTLSFCTDEETAGSLSITVDNEYQCVATDEINVEFICADEVTLHVPNSFSPNYDGINDVFAYSFRGVVEDFEMLIFDRWGEVIFKSTELYDYWDGSDERGDYFVPDGVYNWMIRVNSERVDSIVKRGHVTIMR